MSRAPWPVALASILLGLACATAETPQAAPTLAVVGIEARRSPRPHASAARATAIAQLLPYRTDGRTLEAIRTLYQVGQDPRDPGAQEAMYLAAAASADLAAYAEFREDDEMLGRIGDVRGVGHVRAALYTALAAELAGVHGGVYAAAARSLGEGVELLRLGPRTEPGLALAMRMIERHSSAAHVASLFYVDTVRRSVGLFHSDPSRALAALDHLGDDPCAHGCPGSALAQAPSDIRHAATAITRAYALADAALRVGEEDPFGALVRSSYVEAKTTLSRVPLPERGGARGAPASRILVEVGPTEVTMELLPVVAVIDGSVDRRAMDLSTFAPTTVAYAPRWGAKVVPYEPFTQAARAVRAQAATYLGTTNEQPTAPHDAPPVALVVNDELEAHILARVILSLMAAGLEDVRLRRVQGDSIQEFRLHPVAAQRVDEAQTRGRAKVEIFGPFDYDGATRTLERHAQAGRPASAQLVLFALIASRALYRALDAVRETWPDADPDILLILPAQVP